MEDEDKIGKFYYVDSFGAFSELTRVTFVLLVEGRGNISTNLCLAFS